MEKTYRIGTRTSPLALRQVEEVLVSLGIYNILIKTKIVGIDTIGDKDKLTPISHVEGSDFFTRDIDEALLKGDIDFAIHSAKDLPDILSKGLTIAALTRSVDPYDVLVSREGLSIKELPYKARIGTSSLRRKEALEKFRQDFRVVDIRGNIGERLHLLDNDRGLNLDAIVIAAAGLLRLGLAHRITQRLPFDILSPHPLQGSLAIVIREEDSQLADLLGRINSAGKVLI
ncbi:MAG: hydroxymethylbilane synthase [bacterium]